MQPVAPPSRSFNQKQPVSANIGANGFTTPKIATDRGASGFTPDTTRTNGGTIGIKHIDLSASTTCGALVKPRSTVRSKTKARTR